MRKRDYIVNGESQVTSIFRNKKMESRFIKYFEALKLSGMPVYKYKQAIDTHFDGKIFKHYSYGQKSQLLKLSENK